LGEDHLGEKEALRAKLLDLATMCLEQARAASMPDVAEELQRMADEYRRRAEKIDAERISPKYEE
jgi:hypothetical protein